MVEGEFFREQGDRCCCRRIRCFECVTRMAHARRYAFLGNGLWSLAALSPVPRYAPQFSRAIAKWTYNLANAARYFYGDTPAVSDRQVRISTQWFMVLSSSYARPTLCSTI
eukprot:COSAG02_NODE_3704_length_6359_cov_13.349361_3_plen_111_part_00